MKGECFFGFVRLAKLTVSAQKPQAEQGAAPAAATHFCTFAYRYFTGVLLNYNVQSKRRHFTCKQCFPQVNLAINQLPLRNSSNSSNSGGGIDRATVGGRGKDLGEKEKSTSPKKKYGCVCTATTSLLLSSLVQNALRWNFC